MCNGLAAAVAWSGPCLAEGRTIILAKQRSSKRVQDFTVAPVYFSPPPPPGRDAQYCDRRLCLPVHRSARIFQYSPNFTKFSVLVTCALWPGTVLL